MSLAGKILAVINLLGALGLAYLASADYATRRAFSFAVFRQDLLINGLPVDEKQMGEDGELILPRLSADEKASLFGNGPQLDMLTQVAEVNRIKADLDAKIDSVGQDPVQQAFLLSRILLPLTDAPHEREQLLACRLNFDSAEKAKKLRDRCEAALKEALRPPVAGLPEKPFSLTFRDVMKRLEGMAQDSEPADMFVTQMLRAFPDDREKAKAINFDQQWQATLAMLVLQLKNRYDLLFDEAQGRANETSGALKELGPEGQRTAIARLLFGLAPFQAEDAIFGGGGNDTERALFQGPINFATFQERLVSTQTYKDLLQRVLVVCGLRSTTAAISERATAVRRLADYAQQAMTQERQQFVYDDLSIVELLREQASLVRAEQSVIAENRDRLTGYETVVRERQKEIALLQEDFKKMRADNTDRAKKLRDLSQQVLDLRVRIRDAITANEKGEQRLRELERQASPPPAKSIESGAGTKSIEK